MTFSYRLGNISTTIPWARPTWSALENWWQEYKNISGTEAYDFYVVGHSLYNINETWDIDIALTGDIPDVNKLGYILEKGLDLALNKYRIYIDLKWYSSIGFANTNNDPLTRRFYIKGELAGLEEKIRNGEQEIYKLRDYKDSAMHDLDDLCVEHPVMFRTIVYPGPKHFNKPSDYNKNKPKLLIR